MENRISMIKIRKHFEGSDNSTSSNEGEKIYHANHLILCGPSEISENKLEIVALCLQTSTISNDPHEIQVTFLRSKGSLKISKIYCTCKIGSSGTCKHSYAVLFHCCIYDIANMEPVSAADLISKRQNHKYSVVTPISDYSSINAANSVEEAANTKLLMQTCPDSFKRVFRKKATIDSVNPNIAIGRGRNKSKWRNSIYAVWRRDMAKPISEWPCVKTINSVEFDDETVKRNTELIMQACPDSALSVSRRRAANNSLKANISIDNNKLEM